MLALLAAVPQLFEAGKAIYEAVTGTPSTATTPEQLNTAVQALPPDQQKSWTDQMQVKVDAYKAENERLRVEEGEVTADVLNTLDPETRREVALLRMTTRPKVVLRMTHVVMLPFYVTLYDMSVTILNNIVKVIAGVTGGKPIVLATMAGQFFGEHSLYLQLYENASWPCVTVVITYMTLRQIDKSGKNPMDAVSTLISSVKGLFSKGKR